MRRVIIVGGGLFGSVTADWLKGNGHNVTLIDDRRSFSGSAPAACLMKPSWMTMLKDLDVGYDVLEKMYEVEEQQFRTPAGNVAVQWVNPEQVLEQPECVNDTVTKVENGRVECASGDVYEGIVVVCAGVWCDELLPHLKIKRLTGASLYFDKQVKENRITVWAPYRQAVSFNLPNGTTWFGDGTAILRKNYKKEHADKTVKRARKHGLPATRLIETRIGMRPYIDGYKSGYIEELGPELIVNTGGAKNGTMIAAIAAERIRRMIDG
jgi:glycine/D-amino acid oxidase-like deaminating enzyme